MLLWLFALLWSGVTMYKNILKYVYRIWDVQTQSHFSEDFLKCPYSNRSRIFCLKIHDKLKIHEYHIFHLLQHVYIHIYNIKSNMACWKINPPLNSMILPAIHFLWVQDKYIPREYPICGWLYPRIHDQSLIAHDSPQKHNLLLVVIVIFHLSPKTKGLKYTSSRWWKLPNMDTSQR